MNRNTILDYLLLINQQIIVHEALSEYHRQADAMLTVFLKANISNEAASSIHGYLWGGSENITKAKRLSECLLSDLTKIVNLVDSSKRRPKGDCHAYC